MGTLRAGYAAAGLLIMLLAAQPVMADVIGVGLLESVDIELIQGNQTIFSATGISTTGMLGGTPIYLDTIGGTKVYLQVQADKYNLPGHEVEPDRWMQFTIKGRDLTDSAAASLFAPEDAGEIKLRITNMKFDNVDGVNGNRVEPFKPDQYGYPASDKAFFYMLDEERGFVNLPGSERYSPVGSGPYYLDWPSVQVPLYVWDRDYGFTQVDNGHLTGFELSGIPDFGAEQCELTPVLPDGQYPYFGPNSVPAPEDLGLATEISVNLNMRAYVVPEPTTLLFFLVPLLGVLRRRRNSQ